MSTGAQEEIRMVPNVFDILYLDGKTLIDLPFHERRSILVDRVTQYVAPQVVSADPQVIEQTYHDALAAGHEGIMLKVPDSPYTPGQRGKNWMKNQAGGRYPRPRRNRRRMGRGKTGARLRVVSGGLPGPGKTYPALPGSHRIL